MIRVPTTAATPAKVVMKGAVDAMMTIGAQGGIMIATASMTENVIGIVTATASETAIVSGTMTGDMTTADINSKVLEDDRELARW